MGSVKEKCQRLCCEVLPLPTSDRSALVKKLLSKSVI